MIPIIDIKLKIAQSKDRLALLVREAYEKMREGCEPCDAGCTFLLYSETLVLEQLINQGYYPNILIDKLYNSISSIIGLNYTTVPEKNPNVYNSGLVIVNTTLNYDYSVLKQYVDNNFYTKKQTLEIINNLVVNPSTGSVNVALLTLTIPGSALISYFPGSPTAYLDLTSYNLPNNLIQIYGEQKLTDEIKFSIVSGLPEYDSTTRFMSGFTNDSGSNIHIKYAFANGNTAGGVMGGIGMVIQDTSTGLFYNVLAVGNTGTYLEPNLAATTTQNDIVVDPIDSSQHRLRAVGNTGTYLETV